MLYYKIENSYFGYLTGFFELFEKREWQAIPVSQEELIVSGLFNEEREIIADPHKAARIIRGLEKRVGKMANKDFYRLFLSEDRRAWKIGYQLMEKIFSGEVDVLQNFGLPEVAYFHRTLKSVGREYHRMKAFVRFSKSADGLFVAEVEPDFNVLPLIVDFFKNRYADQPWLIFDTRRLYGIHYDLKSVQEVRLSEGMMESDSSIKQQSQVATKAIALAEDDESFKSLWKLYFKHTNIPARKNLKLHLRHVPRRYWKHLTEKDL